MNLPKVYLCLCVGFSLCPAGLAQNVTETKWVDSGKNRQLLRKINGRWWSQDNREVYPPSKGGVFWQLDSEPGVCQFFHHRPFQLDRAESLHLWMKKEEVEAALGSPNRTFGTDDHAWWYYYASNGVKLEVRFMDDGVLGEAKYDAVGEKSWPVASIERELNGRSIYKLLQERAGQRSDDRLARSEALRRGTPPIVYSPRSRVVQPRVVTVEADVARSAEPVHAAEKRFVSADALSAVAPGVTRQDVLTRLGEPALRSAITGDEGTRESLTYYVEPGEEVVIRLVDGKVVKVR